MSSNELSVHGWTALPRSQSAILSEVDKNKPANFKIEKIELPDSEVVRRTQEYAKKKLPEQTYNHSMRVYYYGSAIIHTHFPTLKSLLETYFLTCLLHDIGTTKENLYATRMSFEFYGGFIAFNLLQEFGANKSQAESVTEAIIRHQDLGESGTITSVGQIVQLATVFDNIGMNPFLISKSSIESVVKAYPRHKWSSCFAATIREEIGAKPWCHTTAIEGFAEKVENNDLMASYE